MTERWPLWSFDSPQTLARYVAPRAVRSLVGQHLPGPRSGSDVRDVDLARRIYDGLAQIGVDYADEELTDGTSQTIRMPREVLEQPRKGNCLDVSLVFAGACLEARVRPVVVVVGPDSRAGGLRHALVLVDCRARLTNDPGDEPEASTAVWWPTEPAEQAGPVAESGRLVGQVKSTVDSQLERYLPVDAALLARRDGREHTFDEAVASGFALLTAPDQHWQYAVDVNALFDPDTALCPVERSLAQVLEEPFAGTARWDNKGPLAAFDPRRQLVEFQRTAEYDALVRFCSDWPDATAPAGDTPVRIAVLHGEGGTGKTRLAAQVLADFADQGWTTGFVRDRSGSLQSDVREVLGETTNPLLLAVDYAEASQVLAPPDGKPSLLDILHQRPQGSRTCLLLTSRHEGYLDPTHERQWWTDLTRTISRHDLARPVAMPPVMEPAAGTTGQDQPRRGRALYRRAVRAFAQHMDQPVEAARGYDPTGRSALGIMLLAWQAVQPDAPEQQPDDTELYATVTKHELEYWCRAYERPDPKKKLELVDAGRIATALTLLAPRQVDLHEVLGALLGWKPGGKRTTRVVTVLDDLLIPDSDDRLAMRPDRLGEFVAATVLGDEITALGQSTRLRPSSLLGRLVTFAAPPPGSPEGQDSELVGARAAYRATLVRTLQHLGETNRDVASTAALLVWRALRDHPCLPDLTLDYFRTATSEGGPCESALLQIARRWPQDVPDGRALVEAVPHDWLYCREFAARMIRELPVPEPTEQATHQERAAHAAQLLSDSITLAYAHETFDDGTTSQYQGLATARRAVDTYEQLAATNPAAYLPYLARSLHNLAAMLAETGQRDQALTVARRAVDIREQLAATNPAAYLPYLAMSLNNLANRLAETGQRDQALTVARRAVDTYEQLAATNPAAYLPDLAGSLHNLATRLAETGQRDQALTVARRAVDTYEQLAATNPAAYLPDLAMSLNNLANRLAETGQRDQALTVARRAVDIREQLAATNPAAYLPDLAGSLHNLATRLAETGQRDQALTVARRAVDIREQLAATNPAAYLPDLAGSLNNLANMLAETGQRDQALTVARRAVDTYEQLAATNPAAYLPDLAMSLNNLANMLAETGQRDQALTVARRAVDTYEQLAATNPAAYLPYLATSLNNLATRLAETGQRDQALTVARRAVDTYEQLAATNPAAYLPYLATSLNNLANMLAETGQRDQALTVARRAVDIREQLAATNPAAYLPYLAGSLHNLAAMLAETGQRDQALTVARRAVDTYEQLAATNPAAYLPYLAMSLNNLANMLAETGQRDQALTVARRAVDTYEQLAATNPAAYLPYLATSLNNLATRLAETGQRDQALTVARRAVDTYEQLAATNPAAYLPYLATSLNNLAARLAETGQRDQALTVARRAVDIREQLAATNPAAYLPDLAGSLHNLAARLAETGQRDQALTVARRAVDTYEQLAATNPAAYLPYLATSLNNLANMLAQTGQRDQALTVARRAVDIREQLAATNPAAYLPDLATSLQTWISLDPGQEPTTWQLVETVRARIATSLPHGAQAELVALILPQVSGSAFEANIPTLLAEAVSLAHDESDPRWAARARQLLRATIAGLELSSQVPTDPPAWVDADVPDRLLEQLQTWASTPTWAQTAPLVLDQAEEVFSQDRALSALRDLRPDLPWLCDLIDLRLDHQQGTLAQTLAQRVRSEATQRMIVDWINTPTWAASRDYFDHHPDLLGDEADHALLAMITMGDPQHRLVAAQHWALRNLIATRADNDSVTDIYALVDDPDEAREAALAALRRADPDRFALIRAVSPVIHRFPVIAALATVVARTNTDVSLDDVRRALEDLSPSDAHLAATTLRAWRQHTQSPSPALDEALNLLGGHTTSTAPEADSA